MTRGDHKDMGKDTGPLFESSHLGTTFTLIETELGLLKFSIDDGDDTETIFLPDEIRLYSVRERIIPVLIRTMDNNLKRKVTAGEMIRIIRRVCCMNI